MTPTATAVGNNGIGCVKLQPQSIASFGRIYAGGDGMATNGLRYGAGIEITTKFHRPDQQYRKFGRVGLRLAGDVVCASRLHLCGG